MNIPFSKITTDQAEIEAVTRVINSGWLAAGKETEAFEKEFSGYISPDGEQYYCIFTNSCTSALKIAYKWAKEQGMEAISYSANTFCATYSAAVESGLRICQHGAEKECLESLIYAHNATEPLMTFQQTSGGFAQGNASTQVKSDSYLGTKGRRVSSARTQVVSSPDDPKTLINASTGLPISGSGEIGEEQLSVNGAEKKVSRSAVLTTSNGQTSTINIPEGARIGFSSVESVTSTSIVRVNVAYGSVKDETPCLIEDSAHRIEPNDPLVGMIRCYSFYATKNMTTGSGGMFVTYNKEIYDYARLCWKDGLTTSTADRAAGAVDYEVKIMAGGYDGNDIAAAIGRVQLQKLPEFTRRRNEIRDRYNSALGQTWAGNHLYPYFVDREEQVVDLRSFLKEKGIASSYMYPGTGWLGVSLPIYPLLTEEEQNYIIDSIREWQTKITKK